MAEKKEGWMRTRLIIEIAGSPKENIDKALLLLGEKFGEGVSEMKVIKKSVREPQQIKGHEHIWSGFMEFEVDIRDLPSALGIIFDYLPSSIEIVEPDQLLVQIADINVIMNDLVARLHQYDAELKIMRAENSMLKRKLAQYEPSQGDSPQENKKDEAKSQ
jgi:hypothetical protein